jgi:hypothetical protein
LPKLDSHFSVEAVMDALRNSYSTEEARPLGRSSVYWALWSLAKSGNAGFRVISEGRGKGPVMFEKGTGNENRNCDVVRCGN